MNRREFLLRLSALTGVGALTTILEAAQSGTIVLITDQPEKDLTIIRKSGIISGRAQIKYSTIQPTPQDITFIENSRLVDPHASKDDSVRKLANRIRNRQSHGHILLTIDQFPAEHEKMVTFEVDGKIAEKIPVESHYRSIVISGALGKTEFAMLDGELSVTRASCRHEICRKAGALKAGKIICAPNKLVASLPSSLKLDSITF